MKFRTIWKNGFCYPQVKRHWYSGWEGIMDWWGNYKQVGEPPNQFMMFTDYRMATTFKWATSCKTEKEAYKHIEDVIKQGGIYTNLEVAPTFNDGFKGFFAEAV